MVTVESHRGVGADVLAAVEQLLRVATRPDGSRPLSDHLYVDLVGGGGPGFVALLGRRADDGSPVGYAQLTGGNEARTLEVVVDPRLPAEMRARTSDELVAQALQVVAGDGGDAVHWWVAEPTDADHRRAAAHGFAVDRTLFQMRRPLPTGHDVTIATRPYVPDADDAAWLAVNNRAFAGHAEQGGWTLDTLRQRRSEPWFDPAGFLIHERDGRMAGFCWTKVHPPDEHRDESLGEIYVIAVDPDFHGTGLGRQLTLAGLAHLAAAGIPTALLYVDAGNAAAVGLYESLGFAITATNVAYSRHVEAETEPAS